MDFYGKDFLRILDFSEDELKEMLAIAKKFKQLKWEKTFTNHVSDKQKITRTHRSYNSATNTQEIPTSQIKHG